MHKLAIGIMVILLLSQVTAQQQYRSEYPDIDPITDVNRSSFAFSTDNWMSGDSRHMAIQIGCTRHVAHGASVLLNMQTNTWGELSPIPGEYSNVVRPAIIRVDLNPPVEVDMGFFYGNNPMAYIQLLEHDIGLLRELRGSYRFVLRIKNDRGNEYTYVINTTGIEDYFDRLDCIKWD